MITTQNILEPTTIETEMVLFSEKNHIRGLRYINSVHARIGAVHREFIFSY